MDEMASSKIFWMKIFEDILSFGRFPFHTSVPKPGEREASVASVNNFTCYLLSIRLSLVLEDETS